MANRLKMAKVNAVLTLHERGWSNRRIARTLNIDRKTVSEYLRAADSKRTKAPIGSAPTGDDSKRAKAPTGSEAAVDDLLPPAVEASPADVAHSPNAPPQADASAPVTPAEASDGAPLVASRASRSECAQYRVLIEAKLEEGLSAQRIHQDLVADHGFTGRYWSVRRFVARLEATRPLPFRRMEVDPGEEAQVDFGTGAPLVTPDGRRQRCYVLRVVLSYSRKAYSQVVDRQTTENFVRAVESAFQAFGGVPKTLVIDNLRAAVKRVDWFEPELNPKVRAFAEHYGVAILPTKPYMPRHKGKVEKGIDYVQDNALKGLSFASLEQQNQHLRDWEANVADTRCHGTTRKHVGTQFREVEQALLLPLPSERFPCFEEGQRRVHRDGHVEVAQAYYSVPPEYLRGEVWVRWDGHTVRVFNQRWQQIALHARQAPGRFSTHPEHIAAEKISAVERGAEWLLKKVRVIGPQTTRWAEAMVAHRGVEGVRVLQGLWSLTKKYRSEQLEAACESAWRHQAYQLRTVRHLLERQGPQQELLPFLDEHPLIRPLSEYGQFVHQAFQEGVKHA